MGLNGNSPGSVATHLEKILSSESFGKSSQTSRLLRFVVERTLEGRANEIKENVLGVEVFGRQSFDPRTDPIVRVEATRLRQKLAYYYESEGKQDAIRITLPKGTYVPTLEHQSTTAPAVQAFSRREKLAWSVSALLALSALALAFGYLRRPPAKTDLLRLSILPPDLESFAGLPANISPDGRRLAFVAAKGSQTRLWIRPLNSLDAQSLPGTEGASLPFWSPDSRTVGFFAGGKLKRVDVAGGAVQTLCAAPDARGGTWNRDGVILFSPDERSGTVLYRVPASGGTPTQETQVDLSSMEAAHRWPQFLPDGTHFLYTVRFHRRDQAIYLRKLGSRDRTRLASADSSSAFVEFGRKTGYLLFVREGSLLGLRIDLSRFLVVGEPFSVAGPVAYDPASGQAAFSVSENGVLAYSSDGGTATEQLVWHDRAGKPIGTIDLPGIRYILPRCHLTEMC